MEEAATAAKRKNKPNVAARRLNPAVAKLLHAAANQAAKANHLVVANQATAAQTETTWPETTLNAAVLSTTIAAIAANIALRLTMIIAHPATTVVIIATAITPSGK